MSHKPRSAYRTCWTCKIRKEHPQEFNMKNTMFPECDTCAAEVAERKSKFVGEGFDGINDYTVNKIMRNGPSHFMLSEDVIKAKKEVPKDKRHVAVIFIGRANYSLGASAELAEDAFLTAPADWRGVVERPLVDVMVPTYWFKRWHQSKKVRDDARRHADEKGS